jgi:acetylornithine deacetylase/succinyl-diaminopimelate desuccinylase-like protein
MGQAKDDLRSLVSLPSVSDPDHLPLGASLEAAAFVQDALAGLRSFTVEAREMPDATLAVFATAPGPPGTPTVLIYGHYDVQPAGDGAAWTSPPWELTARNGRWYGRGAADSKGNIVAHITALRALGRELPCTVKIVVEGSEEQETAGLEAFLPSDPDLLRADAILLADTGNLAVGRPAVTVALRGSAFVTVTVRALRAPVHSGGFGGASPDALQALILMLASLWDGTGTTTITGVPSTGVWAGAEYPEELFRASAGVLSGVSLMGEGSVADRLWARPSLTVLGIDCPAVAGSLPAIPHAASARLCMRVPPGTDAITAREALIDQLCVSAPWNVALSFERGAASQPFSTRDDAPAHAVFRQALCDAYGREPELIGQGGSIPVCSTFHAVYPEADIILCGVAEPESAIHAPNESVHPSEIARLALAEAIFLRRYPLTPGLTTAGS